MPPTKRLKLSPAGDDRDVLEGGASTSAASDIPPELTPVDMEDIGMEVEELTEDSERSPENMPLSIPEPEPEVFITLHASWMGHSRNLVLAESDRVLDLKDKINELTSIPPDRQKILGLVKGKLPPDDVTIKDLHIPNGRKFTLIGTPVGQELQGRPEDMPDVLNDLDIDFHQNPEMLRKFVLDQRNVRKIKEATDALEVHVMNEPRPGKPLLVLDLDYTLVDTKPLLDGSLPPLECARPGLQKFLERCYEYYDLCIWSQTSWMWLESKLVELDMVGGDQPYKISFVLDHKPMFKVFATHKGKQATHSVKALKIIWNKFPQWNPTNTVHVDDLARNFALNIENGIKVDAFKTAGLLAASAASLGGNGGTSSRPGSSSGRPSDASGSGSSSGKDHSLSDMAWYLRFLAERGGDFREGAHHQWKAVARHLQKNGKAIYHHPQRTWILTGLAADAPRVRIAYTTSKRVRPVPGSDWGYGAKAPAGLVLQWPPKRGAGSAEPETASGSGGGSGTGDGGTGDHDDNAPDPGDAKK
ncbi:HAD-like protein [Clavulina sp. PMI_390]|nr:HAD-like protein [Clavulina sp. PMI_390]